MSSRTDWSSLFHWVVFALSLAIGHVVFGSPSEASGLGSSGLWRVLYFLVTRTATLCAVTVVASAAPLFLRYLVRGRENLELDAGECQVPLPRTPWLPYLGYVALHIGAQLLSYLVVLRFFLAVVVLIVGFSISFPALSSDSVEIRGFVGCLNILLWVAVVSALDVMKQNRVVERVQELVLKTRLASQLADTASVQDLVLNITCKIQESLHHQVLVVASYAGSKSRRCRWFGSEDVIFYKIGVRRTGVYMVAETLAVVIGSRRRAVDTSRMEKHIVERLVTEIPMRLIIASAKYDPARTTTVKMEK